jgi:hypothetical protein
MSPRFAAGLSHVARLSLGFPSPAQRERVASAEREPGEGVSDGKNPSPGSAFGRATLSPLRGAREKQPHMR